MEISRTQTQSGIHAQRTIGRFTYSNVFRTSGQWLKHHPHWWMLVFYLLLTVGFTWPIALRPDKFISEMIDPIDSCWRISAIVDQFWHDPLHLYDSLTLYPAPHSLTYDELLTGQAVLAAPVLWLTHNPILAFNLIILSSYALSGFAMAVLVKYLTQSIVAGLGAGLIFTFAPIHYVQYGHLGLSATQWMVFALYFLLLYINGSDRRRFIYLALYSFCLAFQALVAGYFAFFTPIIIGIYLLYYIFSMGKRLRRADTRTLLIVQLGWFCLATFVALLIVIPFVLPFIETQQVYGFKRDFAEIYKFSGSPPSLLGVYDTSWLQHIGLHHEIYEAALYPGSIALILAIVGIVFARRLQLQTRLWPFLILALCGLLLAFGPYFQWQELGRQPTRFPLPYLFFYNYVPGFDALRVPARFGTLFIFGLAVCAGYGIAVLQKFGRTPRAKTVGRVGAILAVLLIGVEFWSPGVPHIAAPPTGAKTPPLYTWLASSEGQQRVPTDAVMIELPMVSPINTEPVYSLYNLTYKRPLLTGSVNIIPPGYDRLWRDVQSFPTERVLDILEGIHTRFLIVHRSALSAQTQQRLQPMLEKGNRLVVVKEYADTVLLELRPSPRYARIAQLIPPGASLFIVDEGGDINRRSLYPAAIPGLLGGGYRYFGSYKSLYTPQIVIDSRNRSRADFLIGSSSQKPTPNYSDLIYSDEYVTVYARKKDTP